ncbi:MAG: hypothetical protein LCH52_02640 [Bacteroidetes bacterium]|nr:hypothetical protein [Bacteroidota bacterium]
MDKILHDGQDSAPGNCRFNSKLWTVSLKSHRMELTKIMGTTPKHRSGILSILFYPVYPVLSCPSCSNPVYPVISCPSCSNPVYPVISCPSCSQP